MTAMRGTEHFINRPTHELEEFLLRMARTETAPAEARERTLRSVAAAAAGASMLTGTAALGTRASVLKGTSWLVAKWLAFGAASGLLGVGVVQGIQELTAKPRHPTTSRMVADLKVPTPLASQVVPMLLAAIPAAQPEAQPSPKPASKVTLLAPPPPAAPPLVASASAIAEEPKNTSRASSGPKSVLAFPPANTKSSLTHELTLLEDTRGALKAHEVSRALQLLDQYRAEFPHGSMTAQAIALRVEALSEVSASGEKKP